MNRNEDITMHDGKEYVSMQVFAERVGVGINTIKSRVRNGEIPFTNFDNRKKKYIEWQTASVIWKSLKFDKARSTSGKASMAKRYGKIPQDVKEPEVASPEVPDVDVEDIKVMDMTEMSSLSKEKYSDCLLPNGGFDYERLERRLRDETLEQKLAIQRGQLVEKTDVVSWAKKMGILVNSALESIPQKYTSVLVAQAQSIIATRIGISDFEFTEEERTRIRTLLKDVGPEIMKSIQLMIMEMEE